MSHSLRHATGVLVLITLLGWPTIASAQIGGNRGGNRGGGFGGYPGGYGGFGGYGGAGLGNQQLLQQLPPNNLRNNYYFYDSIGGMGRTGGTVQIVTQFGLQSQQQNGGGGINAIGGGGYGGYPGYYGVNYQRRLAAQYYQQALMANAYQQPLNVPPAPAGSTNPTSSYGGFTAAPAHFSGFGLAGGIRPLGFAAFTPPSFEPRREEVPDPDKAQE